MDLVLDRVLDFFVGYLAGIWHRFCVWFWHYLVLGTWLHGIEYLALGIGHLAFGIGNSRAVYE